MRWALARTIEDRCVMSQGARSNPATIKVGISLAVRSACRALATASIQLVVPIAVR